MLNSQEKYKICKKVIFTVIFFKVFLIFNENVLKQAKINYFFFTVSNKTGGFPIDPSKKYIQFVTTLGHLEGQRKSHSTCP